jgi:hypothetical protein
MWHEKANQTSYALHCELDYRKLERMSNAKSSPKFKCQGGVLPSSNPEEANLEK